MNVGGFTGVACDCPFAPPHRCADQCGRLSGIEHGRQRSKVQPDAGGTASSGPSPGVCVAAVVGTRCVTHGDTGSLRSCVQASAREQSTRRRGVVWCQPGAAGSGTGGGAVRVVCHPPSAVYACMRVCQGVSGCCGKRGVGWGGGKRGVCVSEFCVPDGLRSMQLAFPYAHFSSTHSLLP